MTKPPIVPTAELSPGRVRRAGGWAVGNSDGELFAVSRRCRHQLADLSEGSLDADGCLVCPWHQARYDVTTGEMVEGPKGFFGYHGRTPGYTQFVLAYSKVLRLRVAHVVRVGAEVVVGRSPRFGRRSGLTTPTDRSLTDEPAHGTRHGARSENG